MLIYDVLHKEKAYQFVVHDLRTFGVKYRVKKNAIKPEKSERNGNSLRKVFKTHLSYLPLDVVNLSSGGIVHVPRFVGQACALLEKCITLEGIFRKAGSHVRQKELVARLDNGGTLGEKHHPLDVANALKTFFRDLPEPLIPYAYHDLFVRCALMKSQRVQALLMACILLPPHHLNTLAFFMDFLKKVSRQEKLNKMGVDNLAKVVGPNVMPLQETTMSAVQSRLETHLLIVKILIENAELIGVLPDHISEALSVEVTGSTENELDRSDLLLRSKYKKKKRRSGSLTRKPLSASNLNLRMFNGLKKMVGKSGSPEEASASSIHQPAMDFNPVHTPSIKAGKKRKVTEPAAPLSIKKKREVLQTMPDGANLLPRHLFSTPVSSDPNPLKDKSPLQKSRVRKYLSHKVHSETMVAEKLDKPKKLRLSLDRLVSKGKQKIAELDPESHSPRIERRWSSVSGASWSKKKRRAQSDGPLFFPSPLKEDDALNSASEKDYDRDAVFMEAEVNLSDDSNGEQASQEQMDMNCVKSTYNKFIAEKVNSNRRSLDTNFRSTSLDRYDTEYLCKSQNAIENDQIAKVYGDIQSEDEEYVRISKSEYEEIKSRVSAIETRISQEFGCISNGAGESLIESSASNVQTEYEKTLGEASIGNITTADNLAKRLGKELKIRRSAEHKVIRSPSARKIGILRRRSQERPNSRRVSRNASWHISQRSDLQHITQQNEQLNNFIPKSNLRRGRPNTVYSGLSQPESHATTDTDTICSDETNARLDFLQKQLHALITHTVEHTRGSLSDDEMFANDEDGFEAPEIVRRSKLHRASSFHGAEFIDNSRHFNKKIKELKKSNSQQDMALNNDPFARGRPALETHIEKNVKWKDADGYFKSDSRVRTPAQQTGRASVAKLRTQNAGMVLAKAKLFDENSKAPNPKHVTVTDKKMNQPITNRRQSMKMSRLQEVKSLDMDCTPSPKKVPMSRRKHSKSPKNNNAKLKLLQSPGTSPLIKMEFTIMPPHSVQQISEKRSHRRSSQKFDQQNLELVKSNLKTGLSHTKPSQLKMNSTVFERENKNIKAPLVEKTLVTSILKESNINIYNVEVSSNCKTPHIKRPLTVKTPKGSRSIVRKPGTDTRRTPMKAVALSSALGGTPRRQSPKTVLKSRQLTRSVN